MRLFIAVNFEPQLRELIASAIDSFPVANAPWRWTHPEAWHVTLKFLGETAETDVAPISRCLDQVAGQHASFRFDLRDFGGFPNLRRPRVLFYRINEGADRLERLASDINQVLGDVMRIPKDDKRFRAHVTVARVKSRLAPSVVVDLQDVPPLEGAVQTAASIDLMKSELRRDGAHYQRLKAFALPHGS